MKKRFLKFIIPILILSMLTGCGSSVKMESAYDTSYDYYEEDFSMSNGFVSSESFDSADIVLNAGQSSLKGESGTNIKDTSNPSKDTNEYDVNSMAQKLIRNVSMRIETTTFDETITSLKQEVNNIGGYLSYSSFDDGYRKNQNITARIPYNKVDEFLEKVGTLGTIKNLNDSVDDISVKYTDTKSRINSLQIEYDRLNELLAQAKDLDSIIALESRLSEVRYEIENYESQIRLWDSLIIYSTIKINIQEKDYISPIIEEETVLSRIKSGLADTFNDLKVFLEDLIVWVVVNFPYILIFIIIFVIVVCIIKKKMKKVKMKKAKEEEYYKNLAIKRNEEKLNLENIEDKKE